MILCNQQDASAFPTDRATASGASPKKHALTRGTTFNVGQGAASADTEGTHAYDSGYLAGSGFQGGFPFSSTAATSWAHMPRNEQKLQKMARQSLLLELWQEQQRTHGIAVDW